MEIIYTNDCDNKYFVKKSFIGFYGEVSDLNVLVDNLMEVKLSDNHKVSRYIKYNEDYFKILNITEDILKKKIKNLSYSELKLVELLYVIKLKAKIIFLNDFDLGFNSKYKNKISKFIKLINASLNVSFIIRSNDIIFVNKTVKHVIIIKNKVIKYQGDIITAIKQNYIDKPPIIEFIDLANKKGAELSYTLDNKELLKDIYRSVF